MAVIGEWPLGAAVNVYTHTPQSAEAVETLGVTPPDWHEAAYGTASGAASNCLPYEHGTPLNASKTPALLGQTVYYLVDSVLTNSGRAVLQARPLSSPYPVMAYNGIGQLVMTPT